MIDILAYLDVSEKEHRVEKIKEYAKKEQGWKDAFSQKQPKKIN